MPRSIFCWQRSILVLSLAMLVSAAMQTSLSPVLPDPATATPFISSTMTECMRYCLNNAADANQCGSAITCFCFEPEFQQAAVACWQSRCSMNEQEAALRLQLRQNIKCHRGLPSPLGKGYGSDHNSPAKVDWSLRLEVGSSFVGVAVMNIILILWVI